MPTRSPWQQERVQMLNSIRRNDSAISNHSFHPLNRNSSQILYSFRRYKKRIPPG